MSNKIKADNPNQRTELIVEKLKSLALEGNFGLIRESGNLSTFSLPNRPIINPAWTKIKYEHDDNRKLANLLRKQRYWLEKHALNESCKIMIHLEYGIGFKNKVHALYRMKTLLEFIKTYRDKVDIVSVPPSYSIETNEEFENILISNNEQNLGLGFFAYSKRADSSKNLITTEISSDSNALKQKILEFDEKFDKVLEYQELDIYTAREHVIELLEIKIKEFTAKINITSRAISNEDKFDFEEFRSEMVAKIINNEIPTMLVQITNRLKNPSSKLKDIRIWHARFNKINRDVNLGIIKRKLLYRELNNIRGFLLSFLDDLQLKDFDLKNSSTL